MKTLSIITAILLLGTSLSAVQSKKDKKEENWAIHGNSETVGVYLHNSGKGANRTNNGTSIREDFGIKTKGKLGSAKAGVEARGRATDDKRVSKNKTELLYLRAFYNTKSYDIQVGDVAQTYNYLVYSGGVKGATLDVRQEFSKESNIKYSMISGVQAGSWKELSHQKKKHRDVVAGDIKYTYGRAKSVAITASFAKDRLSDSEKQTTPTINPAQANTVGMNFDWRFNRYVKSKGMIAWTHSLNTETNKYHDDYAGKLYVNTKPTRTVRSNFKYERYTGAYNPLVGSGSKNRERLSNTTSWSITKDIRTRLSLKGSRDNLDGKNVKGTAKIYDGLVSLSYRPAFLKRGDFSLRVQELQHRGRGDDTDQLNTDFSFRNSHKNGWKYGLAYNFTDLKNKDNAKSSNKLNTIRGNVGYKKRFDENNNFRTNLKVDVTFFDNKTDDQERYGGTLDAGWDYTKKFMFDLLFSSRNTDRDLAINTNYEIYQIISQYKIFGDNSHVLKLSLKRRDYDGGTSEKVYEQDEGIFSYRFVF